MTTTATLNASNLTLEVRCAAPTCGTSGRGKLLFRLSPDRQSILVRCERGHENTLSLDSLDTVRYTPLNL